MIDQFTMKIPENEKQHGQSDFIISTGPWKLDQNHYSEHFREKMAPGKVH